MKKTLEEQILEIRQAHAEKIQELKEVIADLNPEALFADGFDRAIMGYDCHGRVIYSIDTIIETLVERDGMDWEEASEYFSFNIEGSWLGESTPIFMYEN